MHEDGYYLKDWLALLRFSRRAEILPRSTYHDRDREVLRNSCALWVRKLTHHAVQALAHRLSRAPGSSAECKGPCPCGQLIFCMCGQLTAPGTPQQAIL
jgi:hypothetical protein